MREIAASWHEHPLTRQRSLSPETRERAIQALAPKPAPRAWMMESASTRGAGPLSIQCEARVRLGRRRQATWPVIGDDAVAAAATIRAAMSTTADSVAVAAAESAGRVATSAPVSRCWEELAVASPVTPSQAAGAAEATTLDGFSLPTAAIMGGSF